MVFLRPILEINAEFKRAFCLLHKLNFGNAYNAIIFL